jgi:cytochrome c556
VPIARPDWAKYTAELKAAAQKMYKAAQSKNREAASDATNDVAGACENCHIVYREPPSGGPRCTP